MSTLANAERSINDTQAQALAIQRVIEYQRTSFSFKMISRRSRAVFIWSDTQTQQGASSPIYSRAGFTMYIYSIYETGCLFEFIYYLLFLCDDARAA